MLKFEYSCERTIISHIVIKFGLDDLDRGGIVHE